MLGVSTHGADPEDGSTGETRYERDLPSCCRREADRLAHSDATDVGGDPGVEGHFECPACGLAWQRPLPIEPELDAFGHRDIDEREEAA